MNLHTRVREQLATQLARPVDPAAGAAPPLNDALRLLAKWRCVLIQNTWLQQHGTVVQGGPLRGLDFVPQSAEGCHIPKLMGCYEQPLQPSLEAALQAGYDRVLNIGCAEGYYAVGLARHCERTRVLAFDTNPVAQQACAELARKNGMTDRVLVGAGFKPEDFAAHATTEPGRVLVFCDIEGAERDLLDPALAPALRGMDLIVESHECLLPGVTQLLIERFAASHTITRIDDDGQRQLGDAPAWFQQLAHLDQLLAVWAWRCGPTPWRVLTARQA